MSRPWSAPTAQGPVRAVCEVPGSKSETARAFLLAGMADAPSTVSGALDARDTDLMRAGLGRLGVGFTADGPGRWVVEPPDAFTPAPDGIDCGLAGTVMRFLPAVAASAAGTTRFHGDPAASQRPLRPLLDGLRQLGVAVEGDALPIALHSPGRLDRLASIDSSASSQFVSALLLAAPRFSRGLELHHIGAGAVPSRPHIDMTIAMLAAHGVEVQTPDENTWLVDPGPLMAVDQRVEPDLTNAAVFLAAGVVTGGRVAIVGWPEETTQPGVHALEVLQAMGASVGREGDAVWASADGLTAIDIDLHEASELTPVVAALMALAEGRSVIRGVAHIRGHETDRLAALAAGLGGLGVAVEETADGLAITGAGGAGIHAGVFPTRDDHRLAHAAALIGLRVAGVELDDVACTSKTMPDFPERWAAMLGASR